MHDESVTQHLSQIETLWTVWRKAHHGAPGEVQSAQARLVERYGGAIRRYLLGAVRDPEAVEELFQEFALRLLRGSLDGADPERGRFRDFVKGVLFHLIADHHKRRQRGPRNLPADYPEPGFEPSLADSERMFLQSWRDELMARAWSALAEVEKAGGPPLYTVLRFRGDHPDLRSPEMAEQLSARLGKPITAVSLRQTLHRAREKFAQLLLDEVMHSLHEPTPAALEEELIDLGLFEYCRPALQKRNTA
ncbi:MAG TPA: sigma-70 family RNA polymerase sigma factor [Gemmataceae bacterium]|jgi:RNA polymerase sigma factor (sigma-70 family)|nr:sigma-70 family RNA polymerase sigma factor [Gemmataceae bacterium]